MSTDAGTPEPSPQLDEILERLDEQDGYLLKARESLDSTFAALRLTPEEERALSDELAQLRAITEKLDASTIEIVAFGMVSRGKSSVLNALLGQEAFQTGSTHGTTVTRSALRWESAPSDATRLILVDTPGIDEVGGEVREAGARAAARHADLILFVVSSDMQRREFEALTELREAQKPILLVFNQIDRYPDADRDSIYAKIKDERVRSLVRPEDVVMTAARPDAIRVKVREADGSTKVVWERPEPIIEPLKLRVLEILEREGKALLALNSLLYAGEVHDSIVAHKLRIRDEAANQLIRNFAIAKGVAVGLNPIPVADMAGGLLVDTGMIAALSRVYGIPLTRKMAGGLVKEMAKALGALGAVELVTRFVASGVKTTLFGVTVLSGGLAFAGYAAIGVTQGAAAAFTSYVLGQGAKIYLQQGCQWGPKGIKTVIGQILEQAKAESVIDRLRDDLRRKVVGS